MSSASAPRTSPTTSRSGRSRSAARTSERTVTSPTPSTDGGRASSRTTCGRGQAELGRVLDGDDPLARRDVPGEGVEERRLARRGGAADDHVGARPRTSAAEQLDDRRRGEGRERHARRREAADGEARAVDGDGRDHRVDARPVGQPGVDDGAAAVDPQAERRDDPLDEQRGHARRRAQVGALETAAPLDPDLACRR